MIIGELINSSRKAMQPLIEAWLYRISPATRRWARELYNERINEGSINLALCPGALFCPNCVARVATRYMTKMDNKEAYRLTPSAFNKKKV